MDVFFLDHCFSTVQNIVNYFLQIVPRKTIHEYRVLLSLYNTISLEKTV